MNTEQLAAFRDRLMRAVVAASMDDVASLAPIEGEPGTFGIEFRDSTEVFVEITPA